MEGLELISFQIISAVGTAKSYYIEAIQAAKNGDFEQAESLMKEGKTAFIQGHAAHAQLLGEENLNLPLLLVHAEDQMMSCETIEIMAEEIIYLHKLNKA